MGDAILVCFFFSITQVLSMIFIPLLDPWILLSLFSYRQEAHQDWIILF